MQQQSPSSPRTDGYALGYPWDASARLAQEIIAVCPAHGAQIGRWDDRSTWALDALPNATLDQIEAARAIMAAFDPWGDGSDIGALSEDEDPGEQDLGAEMLAAEVEAGENPAHEPDAANDAGAAGASASDGLGDAPAVGENLTDVLVGGSAGPGIMVLPDELGARRNAVLAAITTEKLTRLSIAMDPSRADFLAGRFAEYQNAGALGLPIDEALAADYHAFQELRDRRDRITNYAMQLEQSALDGDMDRLSAMHAGLSDGWP